MSADTARETATVLLREANQRATPQRITVLAALVAAESHLTADQVYSSVSPHLPAMTRSTVYRTLERLRDIGLISETDLGEGVRHFEVMGGAPHHHLICQQCGDMLELADEDVTALRERIVERYQFTPRLDHLAVFGICAYCQRHTTSRP